MGDHCTIEWVVALARQLNAIPASLNPVRGCSRLSEACRNCYAAGIAHRFGHKGNGIWAGLTDLDPDGTPRFNGTLRWVPEVLTTAINAKRSRVYFVCDMSDLFHARVDQDWIDQVFAMMALCRHHRFLLLTKRPDRMRRYLIDPETPRRVAVYADMLGGQSMRAGDLHHAYGPGVDGALPRWPLPNVWTGATVSDHAAVAELRAVPSVLRFLSVEPMLGPLNLPDPPRIDWVIAGGESGPRARPSHPDWFRSLRNDCVAAGVPFFFKQWGEWLPSDDVPSEQQESLELQNRDADVAGVVVFRVGKKAAGRVLDGRTWDEVPEVRP